MQPSFERYLTLIANVLAIVSFAIAVGGWLELWQLPAYQPPTNGVRNLMLLMFCLVSAYGITAFLSSARESGTEPVAVITMYGVGTVAFAFAASYLVAFLTQGMETHLRLAVVERTLLMSFFCFFILGLARVCWPWCYPKGAGFFTHAFAIFRPTYWAGIVALFIPFSLPWLFSIFGNFD